MTIAQAHKELKGAAGLKSPVREIAMQASAQAEGIHQTKAHAREPVDQSRAVEHSDYWQSVQANNKDNKKYPTTIQSLLARGY